MSYCHHYFLILPQRQYYEIDSMPVLPIRLANYLVFILQNYQRSIKNSKFFIFIASIILVDFIFFFDHYYSCSSQFYPSLQLHTIHRHHLNPIKNKLVHFIF